MEKHPALDVTRALVTGGAGFIGSHVVDRLVSLGVPVVVYDDFSTGRREHLARHEKNPAVQVIVGDTRDRQALGVALAGCDAVFHFQANADVRGGIADTRIDLEQNTLATWNVLDAMREHGARLIVFASSATVYGEPSVFPTPETYAPLQTSLYGASKLACEALIQAHSEYFGIRSLCFRFVSWIGERYSHGVIFDFVKRLHADPHTLHILGDGTQTKSYLDVTDGVEGIFMAVAGDTERKGVYNLGHDDSMAVTELAGLVVEALGLRDVALTFGGGPRGWVGDSPWVHLDTARMKRLGWSARVPIADGVRRTVRYLLAHPEIVRGRR